MLILCVAMGFLFSYITIRTGNGSYALLVTNLIMPFVMIYVGYTFKKHPVTDIQSNNGYNTPTSRKTQAHWNYAQKIAPDIFISLGKVLGITMNVCNAVMFFVHVRIRTALCAGSFIGLGFFFFAFYKTDSEIEIWKGGR